jgi:hypothetical protein
MAQLKPRPGECTSAAGEPDEAGHCEDAAGHLRLAKL